MGNGSAETLGTNRRATRSCRWSEDGSGAGSGARTTALNVPPAEYSLPMRHGNSDEATAFALLSCYVTVTYVIGIAGWMAVVAVRVFWTR